MKPKIGNGGDGDGGDGGTPRPIHPPPPKTSGGGTVTIPPPPPIYRATDGCILFRNGMPHQRICSWQRELQGSRVSGPPAAGG